MGKVIPHRRCLISRQRWTLRFPMYLTFVLCAGNVCLDLKKSIFPKCYVFAIYWKPMTWRIMANSDTICLRVKDIGSRETSLQNALSAETVCPVVLKSWKSPSYLRAHTSNCLTPRTCLKNSFTNWSFREPGFSVNLFLLIKSLFKLKFLYNFLGSFESKK